MHKIETSCKFISTALLTQEKVTVAPKWIEPGAGVDINENGTPVDKILV
jgi:hypothetical protein